MEFVEHLQHRHHIPKLQFRVVFAAVSYTHLDVYKRQRGHRPPPPAHRDGQRGREREKAQPGFSLPPQRPYPQGTGKMCIRDRV